MIKIIAFIVIFSLVIPSVGYGQDDDSTFVPIVDDSTLVPTEDTTDISDTLTAAQKALASFEKRQQQFKETKKKRLPALSSFDSLLVYFTSERLNYRSRVARSFFHDAGDYFRSDPSYFVLGHQSTPMRKTVQPFGLSGNRLNLIVNHMSLNPFEHIVEPDGLIDLNDIPTALDNDIFILPGPVGQLFGSKQSVATLLTMPKKPKSLTPESGLIVNKGSFDYAYTRGRYSRLFSSGKEIDLSVGYRNADGIVSNRDDDAYHYTSEVFIPLGSHTGIRASGHLYNRNGSFVVRPDDYGAVFGRHRIERSAEVSFEQHNESHDIKNEIGYRYLRQASNIDGAYKGRFNNFGNGFYLAREWFMGTSILKVKISGNYLKYEDGYDSFDRRSGELSLNLARLKSGWRYAVTGGSKYVDDFNWLPFFSFLLMKETSKTLFILSAGYSERAPSLHELNLRFQQRTIYDGSTLNYADRGNNNLITEKQLVGCLIFEYGSMDNNVRLSITGGKIKDGIDWQNQQVTDTLGDYTLFSPVNGDIDFLDVSVEQELRIKDFLRLLTGGAYHFLVYEQTSNKPYQPDYNLFSGLEMHLYWTQKYMDLFAYGELVYSGEYDGYGQKGLGKQLIVNAKLSFRIKDFRFHYVFQNLLSTAYQNRESFTIPGRYNYYGFVWNFLN